MDSAVDSANDSNGKTGDSPSATNKRKIPIESEYCKRSCSKLYLQEETADVHFVFNETEVGECRIPAHKYMLAIGSPVFNAMFYGNLIENGPVTIIDANVESFKEFLQFFYLDDIVLTIENASGVMYLISKYGVSDCFPIVEEMLMQNFSMEIVGWTLQLAILYDRSELRQFLLNKIMDESDKYFASDSFESCSPDILKLILDCNSFNCPEYAVFQACISWSNVACMNKGLDPTNMLNLRQQLGDCFYLVQFVAMNRNQISKCISQYSELFTREELIEIIAILTQDHNGQLKHFICNKRLKSVEWKDNASMVFSPIDFMESGVVLQCERNLFRSNRKLLFGAFETQAIHAKTQKIPRLCGAVKIFEVIQEAKRFTFNILLEQPIHVTFNRNADHRNFISLIRPIVIEKNRKYDIRFEFDSNWTEGEFTTKKCTKNQRISIQDYTVSFTRGIVSKLYLR